MIDGECANCGGRISVLARSCPHCGVSSGSRSAGAAIAGALAVLSIAIVLAAVVVIGGYRLPVTVKADLPAGQQVAAGSMDDLGWLTTAMDGCEAEAEKDTGTLRFLVIPLATVQADDAQWRGKSLNDVGNAVLLSSDDAIEGLKSRGLRIYPGQYDFRVLDQANNMVYTWRPSGGVENFSTTDSGVIALFNVQFLTSKSTADSEWGSSFVRQSGTCYWVSAIIGN